jgi:hypothetical protein
MDPDDNAGSKGQKNLAIPDSFTVKTIDGEPHRIPYDLQNSPPCFGTNEYFMIASGGFGHDGGHLYVFADGMRPAPGTKVVLDQYPDIKWVVLDEPTEYSKNKQQVQPKSFSIGTSDGKPHRIPYDKQNNGDSQTPLGKWHCLGSVPGDPSKPLGTYKCEGTTPQITVHGDPIFKFGEKHNATRLWLPGGELTPLLKWNTASGRPMTLLGKTFHPTNDDGKHGVSTNNEWFDQLVIKHGLATVLNVQANQDKDGTMSVEMDDAPVKPEAGKDVYTSAEHHKISFRASKRANTNADELHVEAGSLALSIYISKAAKFTSERDRVKYAHLNMKFDNGLPKDGSGVFAELAGMEPMSTATEKLLERPPNSM